MARIACLVLVALFAPVVAQRDDLKLDDVYQRKPFTGKSARSLAWSHDDRYLAYLWNPYDDKGFDIWLFDTKTAKSQRLTSIDLMATLDVELPDVIEKYKKEKEEEKRREKLSDEERRKLEEEDEKKRQQQTEGLSDYPGISAFDWAHRSHEMLFEYRGDIFRIKLGDKPRRITKTQDAETGVRFGKDDKSFFFTRASGVYRMQFDSPDVIQLNPKLPKNLGMWSYRLSPDESKILISSGVQGRDARQVSYITYRERFAQARTAGRSVADDPFSGETYLFLYDLKNEKAKPWEILNLPASKDWQAVSLDEDPWSPDSKKVTFATWKRASRELEFFVADSERNKVESVYKLNHSGGPDSPTMASPKFLGDNQRIVALLETTGYRHPWIIDPLFRKATQLTTGEFEVYPQQVSKDGKSLYVTSWKEHSSRNDAYSVDLVTGAMRRLTRSEGSYGTPQFSNNEQKFATTFRNWNKMSELYVVDGTSEVQVTTSHRDGFFQVHKILPQLFEFKNPTGRPFAAPCTCRPD